MCTQIPKAQKKIDDLTVFFAISGSVRVKVARSTLMKFTPGNPGLKEMTSHMDQDWTHPLLFFN